MLKTKFTPLLVGALVCCLSSAVQAQRPGFYSGSFPGGSARREPAPPRSDHGPPRGDRGPTHDYYGGPRHRGGVDFYFGGGPRFYGPPLYAYPYYDPYWSYGYGTGIYYDPATNSAAYYLPPAYAPAELNFGPLAMERFLGIPRAPVVVPPPAGVAADAADAADDGLTAAEIAGRLRKSNPEARANAKQFIQFGDTRFAKQEFHTARQYYRSAIETAPDLVDAYVREGFALIAVNQYRTATRALKIAIELDPDYVKSGFRLDDLYRDNGLAKGAHLESVANKALRTPDDADLLFLVGMMLYVDGEHERAYKFLGKAAQLGGPEATRLLTPLLGIEAPPEAVPAAPDKPVPAGKDT
jgi:tetratricopeptide (TPR) repeat protein